MVEGCFQELNEKTEAGIWFDFCSRHSNPVLKEVGCFLSVRYEIDLLATEVDHPSMDENELTPLQILEALNWQTHFEDHGHPALTDVAPFMSEWMGIEN